MAENKTVRTDASVDAFLDAVEPEQKRADARRIREMIEEAAGKPATMWGPSIIGAGQYRYRYESGRENDWMAVGFSPRKASISVYLTGGFEGREELLSRLGKHKTGKGCLYLTSLANVDTDVLAELLRDSVAWAKQHDASTTGT